MAKALFLDTNAYLHFRRFTEIDWCRELEADEVLLVIPRVVTRELDDKKREGSRTVRQRAREILPVIEGVLEGKREMSQGVRAARYRRAPKAVMEELELDPDKADDELLATVVAYGRENPEHDVVLATDDTNLRMDARDLEIPLFELREEWRLPEELDPLEKENRKLRAEVDRLKSAAPKVNLQFAGGANHYRATIAEPRRPTEEDIEVRVREAMAACGKPDILSLTSRGINPASFATYIERYRRSAARYCDAYGKYLRRLLAHEWGLGSALTLPLELVNDGAAHARNLEVLLTIPALGAQVLPSYNLPQPPREPRPPSLGRQGHLRSSEMLRMPDIPAIRTMAEALADPVLDPEITEDRDGWTIRYPVRSLPPKRALDLDDVCVWFHGYDDACSFQVNYRIYGEGLRAPADGVLHVLVEVVREDEGISAG